MDVLLNMLKVSAIVGCAVLVLILLKPALSRRYHAKWKYYVWLALALALLVPLLPHSGTWFDAVGQAAPIQIEVPEVRLARPEAGQSPTAGDMGTADAGAMTPVQPPISQEMTGGHGQGETLEPVEETTLAEPIPLETLLTWVWAAGAAAFVLYHAVGTAVFCRRSLRWSRPAERAFVQEAMAETLGELGIRRKIGLWVSSAVDTPMMVGLIRPQLLLPTENYSQQEIGFILKHELTHFKRHDLWYKLALLTANAVHWFNPLAYLLVREANVDMELTCDDAVVAGADRETRRAYSETLLASIHKQTAFQSAALSTHFYGGAETMKERFRNILGTGKRKRGVVALCAVLVLTITAGCAVGFTSQKPEELDEGELADWQEKLNSSEWNGFVTQMYSDVKYLSLEELLYTGAGIDHQMTDAELTAYLDAIGSEELMADVDAISAQDLADYLQEHTGLAIEDFAAPLDWFYLEEYDSYYHMHGDTTYQPVEVASGTRSGDTIQLVVQPGENAGPSWMHCGSGTLTITDGKVVSFTNDLYTTVEAMALVGLRDLADSYQEDMPTSRTWMEGMRVSDTYDGEKGAYSEWRVYYRLEAEDPEQLTEGLAAHLDDRGRMNYEAVYFVRQDADGTVTQLESVCSTVVDPLEYAYLGFTFDEYCRYRYDYELDMGEGRQRGWPHADNRLTMSIQNGADRWTQNAEEVAKGWLMSYGDDLEEYVGIYLGTPGYPIAEGLADQDVVLQVETAGGRELLLLLDHVTEEYGIGDWADTVTYWEVAGYKLVSGPALPAERLGQDYRQDTITLDRTLEGETERVPCFLYQAGGDYGIYTWSMYIPYEQWSCNYLVNRWCPNQNDMTTYMEVRELAADYTPEVFYDSYEQQFETVWTNEAVYGQGDPDTVTVAWALGYQSGNGGRYTESYLFTGQGHVFEVLWTYAAEAAEGWGARMRWAADTFAIIGDDQGYITGELAQVKPGETLVVEQEKNSGLLEAGTYLVLPNDYAYRLDGYFRDWAQGWMAEQGIEDPDGTGLYVGGLTLVYTYEEGDGLSAQVFEVEWGISKDTALPWMPIASDGRWEGNRAWLVVEHSGASVTRSFVMLDSGAAPGEDAFASDLRFILSGLSSSTPVTTHDIHPAIFYDRGTEELYAVSTQPAIMSNE